MKAATKTNTTAQELKERLENFQNDSLVLVQGYEWGFSDVTILKSSKVKLNFYTEDWNGPHAEDENSIHIEVISGRQDYSNHHGICQA